MAELFFTTDDFKVNGMSKPNIPFLVDKNMEPIDVADRWLYHVALVSGHTKSVNTWETYARALYHYFQWLETFNKKWDAVTELDIASYRDSMLEYPNVNGEPCKHSTINQRITIVCMYYNWAKKKHFIIKVPFEMVNVRVNKGDTFLKHLDASGGRMAVNELKMRTFKKDYEYLDKDQVKIVLQALTTRRDQLIMCVILQTGMRREEVIELTTDHIPHSSTFKGKTIIPVKIIGKGNKERTIVFSATLLKEINKYMLTDRRKYLKKYKEKHGEGTKKLWLTELGTAITMRSYNNILTEIGTKLGFRVYPHLNRHTFGYRFYTKTRDLIALSKRLGHSSIMTTAKYSHIDPEEMKGFDEDVINDLEEIFGESVEGYGD
ncbi:MAG TPA: site-specific integrase [Nitrospirota bacterium]|nr:site-specific integrase [Nitrospirota bacterium]